MKKVSIVMPSFNYGHYIGDGINSIIQQSYENWELIIVDDGSRDDSLDVIAKYVKKYPGKIKLYTHPKNENRNICDTYCLGIKKTTGEYVAFLESDDKLHPNSIEKRCEVLDRNAGVVLAYNDVELIGNDIEIKKHAMKLGINNQRMISKMHRDEPFDALNVLIGGNIIPSFSTAMVKKSVLKQIDFSKKHQVWLDWWLWTQLALYGQFYFLPEKYTFFRVHDASCNVSYFDHTNHYLKASVFRLDILNLLKDKLMTENRVELLEKLLRENVIVSNHYLEFLKKTNIFSPVLYIFRLTKSISIFGALTRLLERSIYRLKKGYH